MFSRSLVSAWESSLQTATATCLRCLGLRSFWDHCLGGSLFFLTSVVFTWGYVKRNIKAQTALLSLLNPALWGQIQCGIFFQTKQNNSPGVSEALIITDRASGLLGGSHFLLGGPLPGQVASLGVGSGLPHCAVGLSQAGGQMPQGWQG